MYENVYDNPDKFGLTIVAVLESGDMYDWDMIVVWSDADGKHYWGADSGCSCNEPFDGSTVSSLNVLRDVEDMDYQVYDVSEMSHQAFRRKVRDSLKG